MSDEIIERLIEITGEFSNDAAFEGIDPSVIVPHIAEKLEEIIYESNFRMSGTHTKELKRFCRGQYDVSYLWHWLQERKEAFHNVHGGMFADKEFESLAELAETPTRERRYATPGQQTRCKKRSERSPSFIAKPNKTQGQNLGPWTYCSLWLAGLLLLAKRRWLFHEIKTTRYPNECALNSTT
ncbi:Hypothetical protein PHPALM_13821 [Phytophthora palmivora]|uniref:Uncharacterized protein n=1 Tax=Phytophthora palmivora TaxID=4796 RepID=A0A2P4XWB1_9STRA|nr:Hypothetical protein PHPALM_13821 [Phytophthora palmivora]